MQDYLFLEYLFLKKPGGIVSKKIARDVLSELAEHDGILALSPPQRSYDYFLSVEASL